MPLTLTNTELSKALNRKNNEKHKQTYKKIEKCVLSQTHSHSFRKHKFWCKKNHLGGITSADVYTSFIEAPKQ